MSPPAAARRYLFLTVVAAPANVLAVALGLAWTAWSPVVCNVAAATAITVPTYLASRAWVWPGRADRRGRAVAFWLTSMVNVAASTLAVWQVSRLDPPTWLLTLTPLAVYAALWCVRFVVLDRLVFAERAVPPDQMEPAPTTP